MTITVASRPETYRAYAEECWQVANDAGDLETKAAFELIAESWTMLAEQVETLEIAATRPIRGVVG
jgi:hypothetical protein